MTPEPTSNTKPSANLMPDEAAKHYHVKGSEADLCLFCNKDLRDPVHIRISNSDPKMSCK